MTDARPYPKAQQLGRAERRYRRKVASPKQWAAFKEAKREPCRVCREKPGTSLHHIVPRDFGGDDVADNLAPLCFECHILVTLRDDGPCKALLASLTDSEYAYLIEKGGEDAAERFYGIRYEAR